MPRPDDPGLNVLNDDAFGPDVPRTVLITGAAGNIGQKLRAGWADRYDLILLDQKTNGDPDVAPADLSRWDESWTALFEEVDTVVHLAANPNEFAPWPDLVGPNLDALCHVFHAAALAGVERLVFASSNHAMGGHRDQGDGPITEDMPPLPGNPYGATKLMGERLGRALASAYGIEFVALRIGWAQPGENLHEALPDDWAARLWIANDDLLHLFTCAVEAALPEPAVVVNGTSANEGTRWGLAWAQSALGYVPKSGAPAFGATKSANDAIGARGEEGVVVAS